MMPQYNYNISQGTYYIQPGHKKDVALIKCPYQTNRIQVYDAEGLRILHGAEVYWTEIRRLKKKRESVIQAVVVGIKNCQYITQGKQIICSLKLHPKPGENSIHVMASPIDKKIPQLYIENYNELFKSSSPNSASYRLDESDIQKKYYWVRILGWNYGQSCPRAVVTSIFHQQNVKTAEAQTQAILHLLQIKGNIKNLDGFQSKINNKLMKKSHKKYFNKENSFDHDLPIKDHKQFEDMVFTIDPEQSVDIQDGLSIRKLPIDSDQKQIFQIGVHISDVTSYMDMIQEFRQQIAQRGSSIYLPHKVIHMLPRTIVQMCRLIPKKSRLAFSVLMKLDSEGNLIQSPCFKKTVIKNIAKLSYQQTEKIMNNEIQTKQNLIKKHDLKASESQILIEKINLLKEIAFKRRTKRLKCRAATQLFNKKEIMFKLDEKNFPVEIGLKNRLDSERLVEQFMIMANQCVAKKLVTDYGQNSLVIHHPKPSSGSISHLNDILSDYGVKFTHENVLNLQRQFQFLLQNQKLTDDLKQLLLIRARKIQEHATYARHMNSGKGHFGLNLDFYTHFTSPLRRFADIIVHEQLTQCLKQKKGFQTKGAPLSPRGGAKTGQLCKQIQSVNKARYRNKKLKQIIVQCFMNMHLFHKKQTIKTKGIILSIGLVSATIYIPVYDIVKEVQWDQEVQYGKSRDIIKIKRPSQMGLVEYQLQRNESIDVQIESQEHQSVRVSILFKQNLE